MSRARKSTLGGFRKSAADAGLSSESGLKAVQKVYRRAIVCGSDYEFTGSCDLDAAFAASEPQATRWDYGIGIRWGEEEMAVWIEPHPASSTGEVAAMLAKLGWLKAKLAQVDFAKLRGMTRAAQQAHTAYHWLAATGRIRIPPQGPERLKLAKAGLAFPTRFLRLPERAA